jgi:hypothetical protein
MKHITEQMFVLYEGKSSSEVPYNWFGIMFIFATTHYGTKLDIRYNSLSYLDEHVRQLYMTMI